MKQNADFGHRISQALNRATEDFDREVAKRLHAARVQALEHQCTPVQGLRLAGVGHMLADAVHGHGMAIVFAAAALLAGASGAYVWDQYRQAAENEEIDSELLSDDIPPAAYLDHGFHAWLERSSRASSQPPQ